VIVPTLVHLFAPWQSLYSNSKPVATAVTATHLVALLYGGGFAVAADRATLRAQPDDPGAARRALGDLEAVHRPVLIALGVMFLSGLGMATADVETFAKSPAFVVKLSLVALLVINGIVLTRTERALRSLADSVSVASDQSVLRPALWRRLRRTAWVSLFLWAGTVVAGTVLVNAA
jgi:hypothetical protein